MWRSRSSGVNHEQHERCRCSFNMWRGGEGPHLVLLPLQSLRVVELLRLQLTHPFVQLIDLIPAGNTRTSFWHKSLQTRPRVIRLTVRYVLCPDAESYFSLSSFRWSMFSCLRLAARIFFFFSLSVSFLPPLFWSACSVWMRQIIYLTHSDCPHCGTNEGSSYLLDHYFNKSSGGM